MHFWQKTKINTYKSVSKFSQQFLFSIFDPQYNSNTELCHGIFQCENGRKSDREN